MTTLIIDGNNLVHRCYWVANQTKTQENSFLHVFMFINAIKSYVEKYKPDKIFCCWDEKHENNTNERKEQFADYKGNRDKVYSAEVHAKNSYIKKLLDSLGVKNFFPLRLEADDCMAFLSKEMPGKKVIVTVDRDMYQCINEHVKVYDPIRKREVNVNNFEEIVKVPLTRFLIDKCFRGDKSDNVPGVTGMGSKAIEKYFNGKYSTTDEQNNQFKRNYELFRLDKYSSSTDELSWYKEQLEIEQPHDFKLFKQHCEEMNLSSVLSNESKWYNAFCFGKDFNGYILNLLK